MKKKHSFLLTQVGTDIDIGLTPQKFASHMCFYAYTVRRICNVLLYLSTSSNLMLFFKQKDTGGCECNGIHLHSGCNLMGAITIRVKFAKPLENPLTLFCYAAYSKTLLVDKNLNTTLVNTI